MILAVRTKTVASHDNAPFTEDYCVILLHLWTALLSTYQQTNIRLNDVTLCART